MSSGDDSHGHHGIALRMGHGFFMLYWLDRVFQVVEVSADEEQVGVAADDGSAGRRDDRNPPVVVANCEDLWTVNDGREEARAEVACRVDCVPSIHAKGKPDHHNEETDQHRDSGHGGDRVALVEYCVDGDDEHNCGEALVEK